MSTQELQVDNDFVRITMNAIRTDEEEVNTDDYDDCDVFEEEEEATREVPVQPFNNRRDVVSLAALFIIQ